MRNTAYSMMLSGGRNAETDRAAALLDQEGFAYDRVGDSNYYEPRLRYAIGDDPHGEVIGIHEIKDVISLVKEELSK